MRSSSETRLLVRYEVSGSSGYGVVVGDEVYEAKSRLTFDTELGGLVGSLNDVRLIPPTEPATVFCAAENSHAFLQAGSEPAARPRFFLKPPVAIIGPNDELPWPSFSDRNIFPTAEIAVVIGVGGRDVPESEAMSHVLGIACSNELQFDARTWSYTDLFENKCYEGSLVVGPVIAPWSPDLSFSCSVDGRTVQRSSLAGLMFGIPELISTASSVLPLQPGDLILCGAAQSADDDGVVLDVNDLARRGSTVVAEVSGAGRLENTFVDP